MIYGSVCSGIEAATVAWEPLGWRPAFFAEIDKFPSRVLAHHYPGVPNAGDFTRIGAEQYDAIDLLVGGTPCQSFSVAGLRGGMDDDRGKLALEFLRLADRLRPRRVVWENVPGVLSSNRGRDFGAFLGGLAELGYGFAYRVLDAQHFGVPQRRRRVFVVGHLGDWRRAAAVLFERHSLSGHPAPRREKGQEVAGTFTSRAKSGGWGTDVDLASSGYMRAVASTGDIAHCRNAGGMGRQDYESETLITHSLRAEGFDASEDGTGRGTPLVPIAFSAKDHGADAMLDCSPTLRAGGFTGSHANAGVMPAVAFQEAQTGCREYDTAGTLRADGPGHDPVGTRVRLGMAVRRLTPRECERLQGFPDDYTKISDTTADGPRYKALGNSMAVPVMRWIGGRIQRVEQVGKGL